MPPSKLTRSLSRPFTDLSNLLRSPSSKSTTRPELSNLTTLKKRHSLTRKTRNKKSSTPTPPPFTFHESFSPSHSHEDLTTPQLDIDQIQFESLSPSPSPSPSPIPLPRTQEEQDEYEHLLDSLPYATSRRQWKECSPVLEDPELEAIETSFFTAKGHLPSLREKESRDRWMGDTASIEGEGDPEVEESFVTAREEGGMRESPVKFSRKAMMLPQLQTEEEEEDEEEYRSTIPQDSPTSLTSSTTQNDGSYVVDTPDTSFPSSPGHEELCDEPEWLVKSSSTPSKSTAFAQVQQGRKFTPPRFVEVVETCPTPEGQNEEKERVEMESPVRRRSEANEQDQYRRRSLLRSSELDFDRESIEELDFGGEDEEELATRYLSNYSTGGSEPRSSRVHYTSPTPSTLHLHRSYAPSIISEAAEEEDTSLPASRSHSRNHSRNSTSSPSIFPTVSASELVISSLLSSSQLPSHPSTSSQFNPYSALSHRAPPSPLKHTRPLSASYSKPLRPKHSEVSLFTYDLSHLPAPSTPLERPYRVSWRDLIKPSISLGGGRGSGRFGDLSGAVERKSGSRRGLSEVRVGERVDTPIPKLGRAASVRRSLSRWTGLDSILDINEGDEDVEEGMGERPASRVKRSESIRRSLSRSLSTFSIGGRRRAREEEEARRREKERLDQWVSVVVA